MTDQKPDQIGVQEPERVLTLTDHLGELRDRLVRSAWAIALMTVLCWNFTDQLMAFIIQPIKAFVPNGKLIYLSPTDMFVAHMKLAFAGGLILSCPVWLYQVWGFVAPGLYAKEKKYTVLFMTSGIGLFGVGMGFAYYLVLPAALKFLLEFGNSSGQAMITLKDYLSFFTTIILVFGGCFELPLVIVILGAMGIVDQKFLRTKRRYAVVILALIAAIITPPDILSMMMLLVPLLVLYEISILLVGAIGKKKQAS
jgi:sec-independent protein translocase protein TatC